MLQSNLVSEEKPGGILVVGILRYFYLERLKIMELQANIFELQTNTT